MDANGDAKTVKELQKWVSSDLTGASRNGFDETSGFRTLPGGADVLPVQ